MVNLPAPSSKTALIEDEMVNRSASSSNTALIEDELANRSAPSSKRPFFEDGMRGGRGWPARRGGSPSGGKQKKSRSLERVFL